MLDRLIETSKLFDQDKCDYGPAELDHVAFTLGGIGVTEKTLFGDTSIDLPMTTWALDQVCKTLGPACWGTGSSASIPRPYVERLPSGMRMNELNHWLRKTDQEKKWFVRSYQDEVRAVLSDSYADIGNTEVLETAAKALDSHGGGAVYIHNPVVSPDLVHLRVLWPPVDPGDGDTYRLGAYITNGEIGNRRLGVFPMIQRTACTNSIVFSNDWGWSHVHRGNTRVIKTVFVGKIFEVLQGSVDALQLVLDAQEEELPNFTDYVTSLVKAKGWTQETHDQILMGSQGSETKWGLVQGVSYAAGHMEDEDDKVAMEFYAGGILAPARNRGRELELQDEEEQG